MQGPSRHDRIVSVRVDYSLTEINPMAANMAIKPRPPDITKAR